MARKKSIHNISGNCHLSQQTLDYLKLSKQPFGKEVLSSQTFYTDAGLEKIVNNIRHQAQFSELLLLVEGPHGSGKTSLFRHLLQIDTPNIKLLPVQAEPTDTLAHLQQKASLHLEDMGNSAQLEESLNNLQTFDQIPLLVIDDAHVLSDSTLQALFAYQQQLQQQGITLKILFFANNGLAQTLQKIAEIADDQIYVQSMPQYRAKLAGHFINFKLQSAGYRGEPLFTSKDLQQLDKKSSGSALSLMQHTAQLLEQQVKKKNTAPLSGWLKFLFVALLVLIVAIAAAIYFDLARVDNSSSDKLDTESSAFIAEPEIIAQQADAEPPVTNNQTLQAVDRQKKQTGTNSLYLSEAGQAPTTQDNAEVTQETTSQTSAPVTETTRDTSDATTDTPLNDSMVEKSTADKSDSNKQQTQTQTESISKETTATSKPVVTEQKPQAAKATPVELPAALLRLRAMGLKEADWLLTQKSSRWTIQLLGAREPETLLIFAQRHQLGAQAAWYKTWLSSKPYYVLVYGSYASRDAARAQIDQLPDGLRSAKPWVKSLDSVQKTIK